MAYERLWLEFGSRGEMEARDVIADRLRWDPSHPLSLGRAGRAALLYELLVVRSGEQVAALRDHTAVVRISPQGRPFGPVVVHLSHSYVEPAYRGTGLIAWLRALPLQTARRAAQAAAAVLVAALVAGVRHAGLPLTGAHAPLGMGVTGAGDPFDVAGSLVRAAAAQPALLLEAAALAAVAALLPAAIARGRWGAAGLGALMLAATLLPVPAAAALPLVLAAWITAAFVALRAGT